MVQLMSKGPQDVDLTTDVEKYVYPYPYTYPHTYPHTYTHTYPHTYTHTYPYAQTQYAYNPFGKTPFIWGNGTRYPKWNLPYYDYINNWYYDTFGYSHY